MHTIVAHLSLASFFAPRYLRPASVAAARTSLPLARATVLALAAIAVIFIAATVSAAKALAELLNHMLQISAKLSSVLLTMAVLAAIAVVLLLHL